MDVWAEQLYLMMEKQHNRGQEGSGMACVKLDTLPGNEYMFREKAEGANAITEIFASVHKGFRDFSPAQMDDADFAKERFRLPVNSIWGICAIPPQERVDLNMCIRFCVVTIGRQRTSVCAETSI